MKKFKMKNSKLYNLQSERGVSLVEILIAVGILAYVLVGQMKLFVVCSGLSELSGNMTMATAAVQSKLDEIRNHDYDSIVADYASGGTPGNIFSLTDITGTGVIYVDSSNPDLLEVEVVVSWQHDKTSRVIGEDTDLDGVLDTGEDDNSNGKLDSLVSIAILLADRD